MSHKLFFTTAVLHHTLLLISGTDDSNSFPAIKEPLERLVKNDKAVFFSSATLVADPELPIRLLVGDKPPVKTTQLHKFTLNTENRKLYLGDVRRKSFLIVDVGKTSTEIGLCIDSEQDLTLVYVYIDSPRLSLVDKASNLYDVDSVRSKINKLGRVNGCHICSTKESSEYIPHLLPPPELEPLAERSWYPVCPDDYRKYEAEMQTLMQDLI